MADLFLGRTFTKKWRFVAGTTAETISNIGFRPDYIMVRRIDSAFATDGNVVMSEWYADMANADALQTLAQDTATAGNTHNFETTNGISLIVNAAGVDSSDSGSGEITAITAANPPVVTDTAHGLSNGDTIRITDIASNSMLEVNNRRFRVNNVTADTFELQDPETRENIDGSNFTTFAGTARWNKLNRVDADRDVFDAETYDITLGTGVLADDIEHVLIAVKYGDRTDLGDIG